MSKSHVSQWKVNESTSRPENNLVQTFAKYPTTQITDSGGAVGVVGPGIVKQAGSSEFCGSAVTVWVKPGDILYVLKVAEMCQPGDVLVIDSGGRLDAAVVGDIFTKTVSAAGGAGVVVDGAVRDIDGLEEIGLPVFARGVHPATGSNEGPGAVNVSIQIAGVQVNPGDIVRGDRSGIVVIPTENAKEVVQLTEQVSRREEAWRADVMNGVPLATATGAQSLIDQLASGEHEQTVLP